METVFSPAQLILTRYRPKTIRRSRMKIIIISCSPNSPHGRPVSLAQSAGGGYDVWQSRAEQKRPSQGFLITGFGNHTLMMQKGRVGSAAEERKTCICERACNTIFTVLRPGARCAISSAPWIPEAAHFDRGRPGGSAAPTGARGRSEVCGFKVWARGRRPFWMWEPLHGYCRPVSYILL